MKKEIILYKRLPNDLLKYLEEEFHVKHHVLSSPQTSDFYGDLERAEGIIGSKLRINEDLLSRAPHLKIASNMSVGFDNFDIDALTKHGVMATNTPDVLTDSVADTVFGLLLATARRIPELDQYVKNGKWTKDIGKSLYGIDVHHKTLGIIGMGRIGGAVAKRGHLGFGMNIIYHNRSNNSYAEKELMAKKVSLDTLLSESDFVLMMAPLTKETYKFFGEREFRLMKRTGIFLNASRGEVVEENSLIKALNSQEILAAGLDVYEVEPIAIDSQLLKMDNVVTLPHIGSATKETRYNMAKFAVDNIITGLNGGVPSALINPEVLKNRDKNIQEEKMERCRKKFIKK